MYCKDCKHRNEKGLCESDKIQEDYGHEDTTDMLVYPYLEGGYFEVGPKFGCVHFLENT